MNRLTITVEECNCPPGRFKASAPSAGVVVWSDDPFEAQQAALQQAIDDGGFAYTPPAPEPMWVPVIVSSTQPPG